MGRPSLLLLWFQAIAVLLLACVATSGDCWALDLKPNTARTRTTRIRHNNIEFSRRRFGASLIAATTALSPCSLPDHSRPVWAASEQADTSPNELNFEIRDRKGNKQAIIREDYWYIFGKTPPRQLRAPLQGSDPQWNAFGSCDTGTDGTNSCTYVSLNQRIPAYTKYASSIQYGARDYSRLGAILKQLKDHDAAGGDNKEGSLWRQAETFLRVDERTPPPAPVDAELKMILFATAMLTSPNFPGPGKELLVARFYVNELHHANQQCWQAVQARDAATALAAWEFGKDSWNSFLQTIDRQIVPKVGDKLDPVV